jgi:hypothetical protein
MPKEPLEPDAFARAHRVVVDQHDDRPAVVRREGRNGQGGRWDQQEPAGAVELVRDVLVEAGLAEEEADDLWHPGVAAAPVAAHVDDHARRAVGEELLHRAPHGRLGGDPRGAGPLGPHAQVPVAARQQPVLQRHVGRRGLWPHVRPV